MACCIHCLPACWISVRWSPVLANPTAGQHSSQVTSLQVPWGVVHIHTGADKHQLSRRLSPVWGSCQHVLLLGTLHWKANAPTTSTSTHTIADPNARHVEAWMMYRRQSSSQAFIPRLQPRQSLTTRFACYSRVKDYKQHVNLLLNNKTQAVGAT